MPYVINQPICSGCHRCRVECPVGAIRFKGAKYWIDPEKCIGCPVIALGVPTVTDAATMASDLFQRAGMHVEEETLRNVSTGMIVTSGDIDRRVREIARVLAYGINSALHEDLSLDDLTDLTF